MFFMPKMGPRPFSRLRSVPLVFGLGGRYGLFGAPVTYSTRFHGRKQVRRPFSSLRIIPHVFDPGGRCDHFRAPMTYNTRFRGRKRVRRPFHVFGPSPTFSTSVAGMAVFGLPLAIEI